MDVAVGTARTVGGELRMVDIQRYPADQVNPPEGVKSEAWIKSGMKR
jgi:branched-chain amino acid transport system substrate-binding protein